MRDVVHAEHLDLINRQRQGGGHHKKCAVPNAFTCKSLTSMVSNVIGDISKDVVNVWNSRQMNGRKLKEGSGAVTCRRTKLLELASQGYSQRELASIMKVSPATVNGDLQYLNVIAKESIRNWLEDKIPLEWYKSFLLLEGITKKALIIAEKSDDDRVKLQGLALARDTDAAKQQLLTGSHVIKQTVDYIESTKLKILQSQTDLKTDIALTVARLDDVAAAEKEQQQETKKENKEATAKEETTTTTTKEEQEGVF